MILNWKKSVYRNIKIDYTIMKQLSKYFFVLTTLCCCSSKLRNTEWANKLETTTLNNLYIINDSIYRSEQPEVSEFLSLQNLGIKSILNLREDRSDTSLLKGTNFNYYQTKIVTANFFDLEIIDALKNIKISPKPLLVHCKHGSDRTGVVMAMYRIVFENWTKQNAINELKNGGYGFHTRYYNIPQYLNTVNIEGIKKAVLQIN